MMIKKITYNVILVWVIFFAAEKSLAVTAPAKAVYDIVVYGGSSAGVAAAVQAAKNGKKVVLLSAYNHVGGLSSSGLGGTDMNSYKAIGGLSREFYQRVYAHYSKPESWTSISREDYFTRYIKNIMYKGKNDEQQMHWMLEPHVAEQVFRDMLKEAGVTLLLNERLNLKSGVEKKDGRINSIVMESGKEFVGKVFIDASYEGDLLAKAGVTYIVGREPNSKYGESRNGIVLNGIIGKGDISIDPYVKAGNAASGLLPFIEAKAPGKDGDGDHRTQAYCYRFTLSMDPANKRPIKKPADYNPVLYEMLARRISLNPQMQLKSILTLTPLPNKKTDTNHADLDGANFAWPDGDYKVREDLARLHKSYTLGLLWFLAYDKRVPEQVQKAMRKYGLAKDEYVDNDNFPYEVYVREARRMVSDYVVTEHDYYEKVVTKESVGLATYRPDTHTVTMFLDENGKVRKEGTPVKVLANTYQIAYQAIRPKKSECTNLMVPVCVSSSHSMYSSLRMEPNYMVLGQSAGLAAVLAIDRKCAVQDVPYDVLQKELIKGKQILTKAETVN